MDKAIYENYRYNKCLESEYLTNKIYTEKTYWLKADTWTVQRKRDELDFYFAIEQALKEKNHD